MPARGKECRSGKGSLLRKVVDGNHAVCLMDPGLSDLFSATRLAFIRAIQPFSNSIRASTVSSRDVTTGLPVA